MSKPAAQALAVRYLPLKALRPMKGNAKMHPKESVDELVAIIKRHGWTQPILADERGEIIAGHGRLLAAKRLRMAKVPVIVLKGLTAAQKLALNVSDNKTTMNTSWDPEKLAVQLTELQGLGELKFTGFSLSEFEALTLKPGDRSDDDKSKQFVPEQWDVLVSCAGELSQRELLDQLTGKGYKCRALVR
jgi:ParB-like chromosome segregation protein Spo0J